MPWSVLMNMMKLVSLSVRVMRKIIKVRIRSQAVLEQSNPAVEEDLLEQVSPSNRSMARNLMAVEQPFEQARKQLVLVLVFFGETSRAVSRDVFLLFVLCSSDQAAAGGCDWD